MTSAIPHRGKHKADDSPLRDLMVQAVRVSGLSHPEIARRAGLCRETVSSVMRGDRTGTMDTWNAILGAAGVKMAALSGGLVLRVDDDPFPGAGVVLPPEDDVA